jgi:porin
MKIRPNTIAVLLLLAGSPYAMAQVAGVESSSEYSAADPGGAGPRRIPGRETAPQANPPAQTPPAPKVPAPGDAPVTPIAPDQPAEPAEPRSWFGHRPWWEWNKATGDWAGARTALLDLGIEFNASFTYDWASVWSGGQNRRASKRSLIDANLAVDFGTLAGLTGLSAFADFYSSDVRGGSRDVGSLMQTDALDTGRNVHQLSELWLQYTFTDDLFRLKVGKIEAASEFMFVNNADEFVHGGGASPPGADSQLPTYPNTATGIVLAIKPCENFYISGGAFDGSGGIGINTGSQGPKSAFEGSEFYFIGEAGLVWSHLPFARSMGSGRLAGGGWVTTSLRDRFDTTKGRGLSGGYAILEQQLFQREPTPADAPAGTPPDTRGLFAFVQGAVTDEAFVDKAWSISTGLTLRGTCSGREDDAAGLLLALAGTSRDPNETFTRDELAIETFYKVQVTPFLSVKPYIQHIINPGGKQEVQNATVGGLRTEVAF